VGRMAEERTRCTLNRCATPGVPRRGAVLAAGTKNGLTKKGLARRSATVRLCVRRMPTCTSSRHMPLCTNAAASHFCALRPQAVTLQSSSSRRLC